MRRSGVAVSMFVVSAVLSACVGTVPGPEVGTTTVAGGRLSECDDTSEVVVDSDGPQHRDLESLIREATVVLVGQVVRDDECVLDGEGVQVPYAVSRVEVVEVLDGRSSEATVTVVQPRGRQRGSTQLRTGERVVLFLKHEELKGRPIDDKLGSHYTPLGWDQGIADLDGSEADFRGALPNISLPELQRAATGSG